MGARAHQVVLHGTRSSHPWALGHPFPTDDGPIQHYPIPSVKPVHSLTCLTSTADELLGFVVLLTLSIFHLYDDPMNRFHIKVFVPVVLICMSGCSGKQQNETPQGYLATHIFYDGSKQFVYTVDIPEPAGQGKRGKNSGRPGNVAGHVQGSSNRGLSAGVTAGTGSRGKGGGRGQQGKASLLQEALEAELNKSGYCRKGFMELDRMMEPAQTFIKGECVEVASDIDREKFLNEIE